MVTTERPRTAAEELEAQGSLVWRYALFPEALSRVVGDTAGVTERLLYPPADYHELMWGWLWALQRGRPARPFFAVWPRGGAKSTNGELGTVAVGARGLRRYVLYVSSTQGKANKHVSTIASRLESPLVRTFYPDLGRPARGNRSRQRGWRQELLWTASGFKVEALGMDAAVRGVKIDDDRPDLIILDDIDEKHDSVLTIQRKRETLTHDVLFAGAPGQLAVLWLQNLIHRSSLLNEHLRGDADYLRGGIMSGPHPAVRDLVVESATDEEGAYWRIVRGEAAWAGMSLDDCEALLRYGGGLSAFLAECQHEVNDTSDLVYPQFDRTRHAFTPLEGMADPDGYPPFERMTLGIDFGGPNPYAHRTAAVLKGYDRRNREYRVREYAGRGAKALDELIEAIMSWRARFPRVPMSGRYDGSQPAFAALVPALGVPCNPSHRGAGSVLMGINAVARRLEGQGGEPASYYDPRYVVEWPLEMERYRWMPPAYVGAPVKREPIGVDDDTLDADRYATEEADTLQPYGGPAPSTMSGRPRPRHAV